MLVLTRKINEKIIISNDIVVTLLAIKGGTVRIGIDAPKDVKIIRSEMLDKENYKTGVVL